MGSKYEVICGIFICFRINCGCVLQFCIKYKPLNHALQLEKLYLHCISTKLLKWTTIFVKSLSNIRRLPHDLDASVLVFDEICLF